MRFIFNEKKINVKNVCMYVFLNVMLINKIQLCNNK